MNISKNTAWLFDYDLTLYTADEHYVLESLDHRITLFCQNTLQSDWDTATKIRKEYLQKFGTTLSGLRAMHGVDPDDFFDFIHTRINLTYPPRSPEKRAIIEALPGRKFIFTNGRFDWSYAGLQSMGILDLFDGIYDLSLMHWEGKPATSAYDGVKNFLRVQYGGNLPEHIVMLDDSERNLLGGKEAGFETIYVNPKLSEMAFDAQIKSIFELPQILGYQQLITNN